MNIYLLLFPILLIAGFICIKGTPKYRLGYIIFMSLVIMLFVSLRSTTLLYTQGADTANYALFFKEIKHVTWTQIFAGFSSQYIETGNDLGYVILEKSISYLTNDFHVFSFITLLIFFVPFGMILYKYTDNTKELIFAYTFILVFYFTHLMTGARQVFAIGFDWMAFYFFLNKKYLPTVVLLFLAVTIHLSALLFLIPLLLGLFVKGRNLKGIHLTTIILVPFVMLVANEIISFMGNFIGSEKYAQYGKGELAGGTTSFIIVFTIFSIFCWIAIGEKRLFENERLNKFYAMLPCMTFFVPLIYADGAMMRTSEYFSLFLTILIPYSIEVFFRKIDGIYAYIISITILVLWSLINTGATYHFYWEWG